MMLGISCSQKKPNDIVVTTQVIHKEMPTVFLEQYADPDEPNERTVKSLIQYILDQRGINAKHNADKSALMQSNSGSIGPDPPGGL